MLIRASFATAIQIINIASICQILRLIPKKVTDRKAATTGLKKKKIAAASNIGNRCQSTNP